MRVDRWRVMIVVTREPTRTPQLATAEAVGIPPWDVAVLAAQLLKLGGEVRVVDQNAEQLAHRLVRREMKLWRADLVDHVEQVSTEEAVAMAIRLAREEGLFGGTSTGGNVIAALRLAEQLGPESTIVTLMCDSGMKYLSSALFRAHTSSHTGGE